MKIMIEPVLAAHMEKTGKRVISVEVAQSSNSDIDVTELYVHLMRPAEAERCKRLRHPRVLTIPEGEVLLPNYRLEYDETVTFALRSRLIFRWVTQSGIRL